MARPDAQQTPVASGSASGMTAGVLIAGAVSLLALPSAVLAFSTRFEPRNAGLSGVRPSDSASAAATPSRLAPAVPLRSLAKGPLFLFTPAGPPNRPDRSVTVAVRVDPVVVRGIAVQARRIAQVDPGGVTALRIAPTAFNLGVARGYHTFGQGLVPPGEIEAIDMPDLSTFSSGGTASAKARFSPRIVMDEKPTAGRAPRTFSGEAEDQVDVGGSYRVTGNLNVTAGVRYSQERERLRPLTDGNADNQAVYVGTQFKF